MDYRSFLIARERLRKNWSQEGLCKGICTVSYLSKIESGKTTPSAEILTQLLDRLGLNYDPVLDAEASRLAESCYEQLFAFRIHALDQLLAANDISRFRATRAGLDLELLTAIQYNHQRLPDVLEPCMDTRNLSLQRILQDRCDEAVLLLPNAYTHLMQGISAYVSGSYAKAIDALQSAYELAAKEGLSRIMLECELFIGNSYCNQQDLANMERHYHIAAHLAEDLQDLRAQQAIQYNMASVWIEVGRYEDAYAWFAAQPQPSVMSLHKLAICCEKLQKPEEGLQALDRADTMETEDFNPELAKQLCALVRYRLLHRDYLEQEDYGVLLLDCFHRCRTELSSGYAAFHLPWVLEWYKATRQYKKACELLEEFPAK